MSSFFYDKNDYVYGLKNYVDDLTDCDVGLIDFDAVMGFSFVFARSCGDGCGCGSCYGSYGDCGCDYDCGWFAYCGCDCDCADGYDFVFDCEFGCGFPCLSKPVCSGFDLIFWLQLQPHACPQLWIVLHVQVPVNPAL